MASFKSDRAAHKPYSRPPATRAPEGQWLHDKAPTTARSRPVAVPVPSAGGPTDKILVSNLHYEITPKDLTAIFGQIGTLVREPLIRYDRSGRSSGSAIVSFETVAEAVRARKQFEGILAKGQPMSIDFLTPKQPRARSASAPNGSLLNRIQKPPLLDRLSRDDTSVKSSSAIGRVGPVRSKVTRATRKKPAKKPATAEELDKELDAFMGDASTSATPAPEASTATAPAQDIDMA